MEPGAFAGTHSSSFCLLVYMLGADHCSVWVMPRREMCQKTVVWVAVYLDREEKAIKLFLTTWVFFILKVPAGMCFSFLSVAGENCFQNVFQSRFRSAVCASACDCRVVFTADFVATCTAFFHSSCF